MVPLFSFILTHTQKEDHKLIITNINENHKTSNIKNCQNYFFNDMTNIGDFDLSLLNIDQIAFKSNDSIYDIIKNLDYSNPLYLVFKNLDAYIEKSGENKYLIFASTDKNEMVLGDYIEIWDEIKEQTELISGNKVIKYSRDLMINIPVCVIIIGDVFEEDRKYYPKMFLHECFYEHKEDINPFVVNWSSFV